MGLHRMIIAEGIQIVKVTVDGILVVLLADLQTHFMIPTIEMATVSEDREALLVHQPTLVLEDRPDLRLVYRVVVSVAVVSGVMKAPQEYRFW